LVGIRSSKMMNCVALFIFEFRAQIFPFYYWVRWTNRPFA